MKREITKLLRVFTLLVTIYVKVHSQFTRYATILTPLPFQWPFTTINQFCFGGECFYNPDLNAYTMLLRRNRRIPQTISITPDERTDLVPSWQHRQLEFTSQDMNKSGRKLPIPYGLNTPPSSMKSVKDFMSTHLSVTPNVASESVVHTHSEFYQTLDKFERKFYMATFTKLSAISSVERKVNGVSFVQSGFFLYVTLVVLSVEVDMKSKIEIDKTLELSVSDEKKIEFVKHSISSLPTSSQELNFRWVHRLAVNGSWHSKTHALDALGVHVHQLPHLNSAPAVMSALNRMVEEDSGGAMCCTFTEDEVLHGVRAALLSTIYLRARWRSAPTLLNGTHAFYDGVDPYTRIAKNMNNIRQTHMIRINDIMRYADLSEWDAEALEIFYSTPHLSLLIVVPKKPFLRPLVAKIANTSIHHVTNKMRAMRVGVKLPIYTLRMTLLLPNKLEDMGISYLLDPTDRSDPTSEELKISHAVQRFMFWADAGRHAFKDDGIEWGDPTHLEMTVNRPHVFFLRWKNMTLANGNFVL